MFRKSRATATIVAVLMALGLTLNPSGLSPAQATPAPESFNEVVERLEKGHLLFSDATLSMIPRNAIEVAEEKTARSLLRLLENLEDHDDVQKVHANFDIDDDLMDLIS